MKRHPGHRHRLPRRLAALRQRDVQQLRRFFCVGVEKLVKIAHAVEQQGVGVVGFQAQVLRHHRGVLRQVGERAGRRGIGGGMVRTCHKGQRCPVP